MGRRPRVRERKQPRRGARIDLSGSKLVEPHREKRPEPRGLRRCDLDGAGQAPRTRAASKTAGRSREERGALVAAEHARVEVGTVPGMRKQLESDCCNMEVEVRDVGAGGHDLERANGEREQERILGIFEARQAEKLRNGGSGAHRLQRSMRSDRRLDEPGVGDHVERTAMRKKDIDG